MKKMRLLKICGVVLVLVLLVTTFFVVAAPVSAAEPIENEAVAVAAIEADTSAQSAMPGILILSMVLVGVVLLITVFAISRRRHSRSPPVASSAEHTDSTFDIIARSGQVGRSIIGRILTSLRVSVDISAAQT